MTMPDTLNPDDFIISIDGVRKTVDIVGFMAAHLQRDWKAENTDGMYPTIEFQENSKVGSHRDSPFITLYEMFGSNKKNGLGYGFVTPATVFSVDYSVAKSRLLLKQTEEEILRILYAHRVDTVPLTEKMTGRFVLDIGHSRAPQLKKQFRRVIDCTLTWHYRRLLA